MAEKKHKSQAEKVASGSKSKNSKSTGKSAKATSKTSKNKTPVQENTNQIPVRAISSIAFLGLFLLLLITAFLPDEPAIKRIQYMFYGMFGKAAFFAAIPGFLFLFVIHAFSGKHPVKMRTICVISLVLICGIFAHLTYNYQGNASGLALIGELYETGTIAESGGVICGLIGTLLYWLCNWGAYVLLIIAGVLTLLGAFQITIPSIIRAIQNRPKAEWEIEDEEEPRPEPAEVVVNHIANKRIEHIESKRQRMEEAAHAQPAAANSKRAADIMRQIDADIETPVAVAKHQPSSVVPEDEILTGTTTLSEPEPEPVQASVSVVEPVSDTVVPHAEEAPEAKPVLDTTKQRKVTAADAEASAAEVAKEIAAAETIVKPVYLFPPIELLRLPGRSSTDGTAEMRENTQRLNETLASFKIEAHIINVTRGPSVTRYEVELEKGVRLSKLTTAADDIALSLGASGVRIAAVPGKISVVGIEVPNLAVTTVSLREVIDSEAFNRAKSKSAFSVGKDISGNCIVGDISKLPHMLIAGTTGSGKSVCMNSIIISLLYKASPDDVKLIMVDPKMVELGVYNSIPHLLIPVVTDPKKAAGSLQWAVTEMMRRYKAMSDAGVRDLESYNSIIDSQEVDGQKLPQVVVIIDELADLMLVAAKEVEESICRIAQMGRAAGIHLIIATQRPSADVITGLMKANIPSRIAFAVASAMESRIILDTQGAEKLVGRGDMLYAPIGTGKPQRVQGCFVSDAEVESVANYVKSNYTTTYDQQVMEEIERKATQAEKKPMSDPEPTSDELSGDEMLPQAVDVILETGQASVSMLQRRLKLGYARAARIVDEMEEKGIVGPFQGSKPRAILVTKEQWENMKSGQSGQLEFADLSGDVNSEVSEGS